jgi:tetratricopeptide (TPR) repeat protein
MSRIFFVSLLFVLIACRPKQEVATTISSKDLLENLNNLTDSLDQHEQVDKLEFWNTQLRQKDLSRSNAAQAFIHYQIAKNLVRESIDSARHHINIAVDLSGREPELNEVKFTVYNGAGLIAELEGKFYQAVYYFNKSAAIIMSDDSLRSKPLAKVICLLNAAQDNNKIHQYQKAIQQNKLALTFLERIPNNNYKYSFRAYSQLFTAYVESGSYSVDSLHSYLQQLQTISSKTNDPLQVRFTNEHTGNYYSLTTQYSTAIPYYKLVEDYDKENLVANPQKISAAKNVYITMANLIDLYVQTRQYPEAEVLIQEAAFIEREYSQALSFYERAMNKQAKTHYYFATHNIAKAQHETQGLLDLRDAILKNAGIQATEEMTTLYQLQVKDKSITSLSQTVHTTTQKNKLLLYIIGLVVLLAASWIVLLFFIQRQRKQRQEQERTLLQQQLLRTQMEPHFIFNTLSALQSFIRFDQKEKSIKYLNQFSRLLRSSLELSRQNYVPLSEELEALENYLSLQQMRFEDSFSYEIAVPDTDTSTILIPPMLIQPFVENAIIHGFSNRSGNGRIVLEILLKEKQLRVKVMDNGKGIGASKSAANRQSLSGTIARERLEILARENKTSAHVEINSTNNGTSVLLTLPVKSVGYARANLK